MFKKTLVLLMILCVPLSGIAWADTDGAGVGYFAKESALIISNVVLFPFRLLRDIFDPQPLPPRPVVMAYPYPVQTVVAAAPAAPAAAPAAAPSAPAQSAPVKNPLEITIPNGDGSYTSVTLTKTDQGFLGPQGEFYPDHPTEAQLKARYCKR